MAKYNQLLRIEEELGESAVFRGGAELAGAGRRRRVRRPAAAGSTEPMIRRAVRHRVGVAVAALALVGVLFLAVFPTQAYLAQRRDRDAAGGPGGRPWPPPTRPCGNGRPSSTPTEEIERLARLQYHLVRPGEEAYVILPDGTPPTTAAPPPPPAPAERRRAGSSRAWSRITSIF